ncbi:MAG: leucine-rich repeat protein [Oscillospiraceae bacterium]|nr:leucine-rich repeat protein [Oscillospiraceae bacterium]
MNIKKKFAAVMAAVCMTNAFSGLALVASAADSTYENLTYVSIDELMDGTYDYVEITGCDAAATTLEIPAAIGGVPVTCIADNAFSENKSITSVTIPDSVTNIGASAFFNCTALTDLTFGNGVTTIEDNAFEYCTSLAEVTLPDSLTSIGVYAFARTALTSVVIPDSVTEVKGGVFNGCASLESAKLSENMTSLPSYTRGGNIHYGFFAGCGKLESIVIPDSITFIGTNSFEGCSSLSSVTIGKGVTEMGFQVFRGCGNLVDIVIPENVKVIGAAFDYSSFKTVRIEGADCEFSSITRGAVIYAPWFSTAHVYAWNNNHEFFPIDDIEVTDIEPNLIYEIVDADLDGKNDYAKITDCYPWATEGTFPEEIEGVPVREIGAKAFENCKELLSVRLPMSVKTVGENAFYNCTSLKGVRFDNPNCAIWGNADTISNTEAVIYGYDGSSAAAYAETYGRSFVSLGEYIPEYVVGDVTGDEKVNLYDAIQICRYIMETADFTDDEIEAADYNGDGTVNLYDVIEIARYMMA